MKLENKILWTVIWLLLAGVSIPAQPAAEKSLSFLAGTWKIEGRNSFEVWEKSANSILKGKAYKLLDGKEVISETFEIKSIDRKIFYLATVPDQNNGATVRFALTAYKNNEFVFENPEHDFPKKMVYKKISRNELFVQVAGAGGKGFSFTMKKQ